MIASESAAAYAQRAAAAAGAHSPFARGPYGLGGQAGSPYGVAHSPSDAVAASLYARQRAQYGLYGGQTPAAAAERAYGGYGVPAAAPHEPYTQPYGRSAQEMSLIDRAAAYNAQQRQAEQASAALLHQTAAKSPTASSINASTLSYMQKGAPKISSPKLTPTRQPIRVSSASTPQSVGSGGSPLRTPSSAARPRPKTTPRTSSSEKEKPNFSQFSKDSDVDGDQKWFSGCVPLGLEDDKYWLSELQVYLRGNFAESFGATEEGKYLPMDRKPLFFFIFSHRPNFLSFLLYHLDIAAPMHGRNKPIALGQVGIRCMHCKRKYRRINPCSLFLTENLIILF